MNIINIPLIYLEIQYLEAIEEIGVYEIFKSTNDLKKVEEFLKRTLVLAAKSKGNNIVSDICSLLLVKKHPSLNHIDKKRRLKIDDILHSKDEHGNSAMYYANLNMQLLTGLDLLYVENKVHADDRDGALKCLRVNAGYLKLDQWLIDSYKLVHPSDSFERKVNALLVVSAQLLLSYFIFF